MPLADGKIYSESRPYALEVWTAAQAAGERDAEPRARGVMGASEPPPLPVGLTENPTNPPNRARVRFQLGNEDDVRKGVEGAAGGTGVGIGFRDRCRVAAGRGTGALSSGDEATLSGSGREETDSFLQEDAGSSSQGAPTKHNHATAARGFVGPQPGLLSLDRLPPSRRPRRTPVQQPPAAAEPASAAALPFPQAIRDACAAESHDGWPPPNYPSRRVPPAKRHAQSSSAGREGARRGAQAPATSDSLLAVWMAAGGLDELRGEEPMGAADGGAANPGTYPSPNGLAGGGGAAALSRRNRSRFARERAGGVDGGGRRAGYICIGAPGGGGFSGLGGAVSDGLGDGGFGGGGPNAVETGGVGLRAGEGGGERRGGDAARAAGKEVLRARFLGLDNGIADALLKVVIVAHSWDFALVSHRCTASGGRCQTCCVPISQRSGAMRRNASIAQLPKQCLQLTACGVCARSNAMAMWYARLSSWSSACRCRHRGRAAKAAPAPAGSCPKSRPRAPLLRRRGRSCWPPLPTPLRRHSHPRQVRLACPLRSVAHLQVSLQPQGARPRLAPQFAAPSAALPG